MPDIDLKAKLGPLPVWGWGIIVGVIALIGYLMYSRRSAGEVGGPGASTGASNLDAMGYQTVGIKGGSATTETTVPPNNVSWLERASRAVADILYASPSEVYAALQKWLIGDPITVKEKSYVDKAIQVAMSPPEGTQGISTVTNNPVSSTTDKPISWRTLNTNGRIYAIYVNRYAEATSAQWKTAGSPARPRTSIGGISDYGKRIASVYSG